MLNPPLKLRWGVRSNELANGRDNGRDARDVPTDPRFPATEHTQPLRTPRRRGVDFVHIEDHIDTPPEAMDIEEKMTARCLERFTLFLLGDEYLAEEKPPRCFQAPIVQCANEDRSTTELPMVMSGTAADANAEHIPCSHGHLANKGQGTAAPRA